MGNSYIKNMVISIHTSAREVTQSNSICSRIVPDFNPHFRKGSDKREGVKSSGAQHFNPHFRKGSDLLNIGFPSSSFNFNPHFRKGSDDWKTVDQFATGQFQSTLPQGK